MPKTSNRTPKYCRHKASGQGVVTLNGKDFYLGKFGTAASKREYARLTGQWLAAGGVLVSSPADSLTITELLAAFWRHAKTYYADSDGGPSQERRNFATLIKRLRQTYGDTLAAEFGPLKLKAFRQTLIDDELARKNVNRQISRVRQIFKWAVENELTPAAVVEALRCVAGLRYGKSEVRETEPVRPVPDALVDAVLPHVAPQIRAMIDLQRIKPFQSPRLREAVLKARQSLEQVIDEQTRDKLLKAGFDAASKEKAQALVTSFRQFIDDHKDEIEALQLLYSKPYRAGLRYSQVKALAKELAQPPHRFDGARLWQAYKTVEPAKVKADGGKQLADLIALVRHALDPTTPLVPVGQTVQERYEAWLAEQTRAGRTFTPDQSILKRAFAGQLVPQDPHDEPATALLARLKRNDSAVVERNTFNSGGPHGATLGPIRRRAKH